MEQIVLVCGQWRFDKNRWFFFVDKSKGCRILSVDQTTSYADLVQMVYEDFGLQPRSYEVQLSYMLSKEYMQKLPQDTPPVFVGNCRQLSGFLQQFRNDRLRLCVEIIEKTGEKSVDESHNDRGVGGSKESSREEEEPKQEVGEDEEEECIFDYCDDPDGASSGDEDYNTCPKFVEDNEEEEIVNLPPKKRTSDSIPGYVKLEMYSVDLAVGQCYATKEELENRLKMLSVAKKFNFDVVSSTTILLTVRCWVEGCQWRVCASTIGESPQFHIKTYVEQHTCSVTQRSSRARQATPEILGRLYKQFVGGVGPSVLPSHVADCLTKRYGIKMPYWKARRTLLEARALVSGTSEDSYDELPSYLYMIRRANPGTLIKLEVDEEDRFKFLFLAFGASIHGFPFLRKVVVVDGTFLQGKYKGTLLIATMHDGNFNIFPIAFAVVDTENDESWEWFFRQLNRIIPDDDHLAIISDRQKSLGKAIKKVYPLSSRGICTYHLRKNILLKFRGGEAFRLFKKAATAYTLLEFNDLFGQIESINPALHRYLETTDVRLWSRAHFPGDRYNFTTSNIAESINHALSVVRSYPIVQLIDAIRSMLTRWFATRRKNASVMKTTLTTGVEKLLKVRVGDAKQLIVQEIDDLLCKVTASISSHSHIVNLKDRMCTCRRFDLEKMTCAHAIAATYAKKQVL